MNKLAVLSVTIAALLAAPLSAQRGTGGAITRNPPGTTGFPRPGFLDPGPIERRPMIAAHFGPIPFPPADKPWVRADTAHFILFGATGENAARAVAHDLEKMTALLTRTSAYFRLPTERTRVFLFAERRNVQPYFDAVGGARVDASGITLRHVKGSTMLIDTTVRGGGGLTPRHELVHDLIHRDDRPLPLWLEEGLAEYYSNAGLPIREHASRLRGRLRMPLSQMFATRVEDPRAWTFDFYAQSWAAVATLMRRDRAAFWELLKDVDEGRDTASAIEARYRMTPRDFEIAMRKAAAPAKSLVMESGPATSIEVKPLARAELLFELGELLGRVKGREEDAERHFRAALESDARTARPYLERAYEGAPERFDVAFPLFSLYVTSGERERADGIFARIVDSPRGYDARKLLLKTDLARADALARDGRLREAVTILRDLAPKMPGKTRADLEGEAVRLERMMAGGNH